MNNINITVSDIIYTTIENKNPYIIMGLICFRGV